MSKRKINLFFAIITFFTLALTACSNNNSATKKSTTNQISVNYTLKEGKKTFDKKTVKVPKKAKVNLTLSLLLTVCSLAPLEANLLLIV